MVVPIFPLLGGWDLPNFKFPTVADVVADLKHWITSSMEHWYGFIGSVFESMTNLILYTPEILINNPQVQKLWWIMISVTVGLMMIMCLVEAIKTVLGFSRANILQLVGRTALAFTGLSVVLPSMTYGLHFVNQFIDYFTTLAYGNVSAGMALTQTLSGSFANGAIGFLASIIFLLLFLYYMFRILLYYGRRWFDIMISAIVSPFAFGSLVFDSTAHYFQKWWTNVLQLYMVQVVHAIYVTVLSLVVLAPGAITSVGDGFIRILIVIGALWRMSSPPKFISNMSGSPDSRDMIKHVARKMTKYKALKKISPQSKS